MLGADHFSEQDRAGGPLASKADAHESAGGEQLREILREARQEREDREKQDRDLERSHAAEAVGEPSGHPTAGGRHQQRGRA